jgi:hypothetical protein
MPRTKSGPAHLLLPVERFLLGALGCVGVIGGMLLLLWGTPPLPIRLIGGGMFALTGIVLLAIATGVIHPPDANSVEYRTEMAERAQRRRKGQKYESIGNHVPSADPRRRGDRKPVSQGTKKPIAPRRNPELARKAQRPRS